MQSGPAIHPDSTGELRRYEALLEMADLMVRHGSLPELFHEMAGRLRKVADFQFLNFSVHDPLSNRMHPHWWEGESTADLPMELPVSESASGWAWEEELRFRDFHGETRFPRVLDVLRTKGTRTYYMMPLTTTQKRLGALGVARSEADAYREDRRLLRRVAELVALAVPREPLLDLLQRHGEAGLRSAQALSREFQSAQRDIRDLILARSSAGKLARLLPSWTPSSANGTKEIRVSSGLTHEEMAQMIGASRETVTRLLSDLRKKQLIRLEGSTLVIRNRMALEALVS